MNTEPKDSFYRRPLPEGLVSFTSMEGRRLLREALTAGDAEAFYPLVAHLHTQAEPAWCGIGTLVTVLNALEIDPGRIWKGPWRFFGEDLLTCCKSLDLAAVEGMSLSEVACLAQCNGARVQTVYAEPEGLDAFRTALLKSLRAPAGPFMVANYDRATLGQTGTGHFSPLAAWHQASDQVLILDVARFKYPPHWVPVSRLWAALQGLDAASARPRGYLLMERADAITAHPAGLAQLLERLRAAGAGACLTPPTL